MFVIAACTPVGLVNSVTVALMGTAAVYVPTVSLTVKTEPE